MPTDCMTNCYIHTKRSKVISYATLCNKISRHLQYLDVNNKVVSYGPTIHSNSVYLARQGGKILEQAGQINGQGVIT